MAEIPMGFEPRPTPAARRALFDIDRRLAQMQEQITTLQTQVGAAEAQTVTLSLTSGSADSTTGRNFTGSVAVPASPVDRLALITFTVLLSNTGVADLYVIGGTTKRMRVGTETTGRNHGMTIIDGIAAGASPTYLINIKAVGAAVTCSTAGSGDLNFLSVMWTYRG